MTHEHFRICVTHGALMDKCIPHHSIEPGTVALLPEDVEPCGYMCGICTSSWPCKVENDHRARLQIQADREQHIALTKACLDIEKYLTDWKGDTEPLLASSVNYFQVAVQKSKDLLDIL